MSNALTHQTPIAVVDKDGFVWPWDPRIESKGLLASGSKFIYTKRQLREAMKSGTGADRVVDTITDEDIIDSSTKPKETVPLNQKEVVQKILG